MSGPAISSQHVNVVIVGAGLSGIGAAYRLQTRCPNKSYLIFEAREQIGGTWDLFRYPGIRSDSDMFTLGYPFRPWKQAKSIADGPSILHYIRETAEENGIIPKIRFKHWVRAARWSSSEARWNIEVEVGEQGENLRYTCDFLFVCSGYYRYDQGHTPEFPGSQSFKGRIVHPQKWPEDLDYAGKRIVVIGSGATAVTLVPAMAERAAHVTMLQRSPSYVAPLPDRDVIGNTLRRLLPEQAAHGAIRWKNMLLTMGFYQLCRRAPAFARKLIRRGVEKRLPKGYEVDTHFNPRYEPWDQRLCLVPNDDLFKAISNGRASVVTGQIETFTEKGIRLASGQELDADIVVTATGLNVLVIGGMKLSVDGRPVEPGQSFVYKGLMLSNVPNFAFCVGYTNASWTLRSDLSSIYVCRVLNHMDKRGYQKCMPVPRDSAMRARPLLGLNSGYVLRAAEALPKQGPAKPWFMRQNYILDAVTMKVTPLTDGVLQFSSRQDQARQTREVQALTTAGS